MSNSDQQISRHCVDAAISYANDPKHGGNGYTLRVTCANGDFVEGAVAEFDNQHPEVLLLLQEVGLAEPEEVFLDKSDIKKAVIVW